MLVRDVMKQRYREAREVLNPTEADLLVLPMPSELEIVAEKNTWSMTATYSLTLTLGLVRRNGDLVVVMATGTATDDIYGGLCYEAAPMLDRLIPRLLQDLAQAVADGLD